MVFQLIDGFFEERPRVGIANEQPPVLDLDIMVENGVGRGVHIGDKSVLVDCDRGQAHRIERGGRGSARSARSSDGGNLDQAPGEGSENTLFLSAQIGRPLSSSPKMVIALPGSMGVSQGMRVYGNRLFS